jgi:hypothetical protein
MDALSCKVSSRDFTSGVWLAPAVMMVTSASRAVIEVACQNLGIRGKQGRIPQIIGLTFGAFSVAINENNFPSRSGHEQCVGSRGAHEAGPNNNHPGDGHRTVLGIRTILHG